MITVCLTYFKSLALANLRAALFSLTQQDLGGVAEVVILDNDTHDTSGDVKAVVDEHALPVPVRFVSVKHGDPDRTHSWSTNRAVGLTSSPFVIFTRADYILDRHLVSAFRTTLDGSPNAFVTGRVVHLSHDVGVCESLSWRAEGPRVLRSLVGSAEGDYMTIDAGVWALSRANFEAVGGLDEGLTAWGHAQTHFQWKLHEAGVEMISLPNVHFYHPRHAAERDLGRAHQQARDLGLNLQAMWARYPGESPY